MQYDSIGAPHLSVPAVTMLGPLRSTMTRKLAASPTRMSVVRHDMHQGCRPLYCGGCDNTFGAW